MSANGRLKGECFKCITGVQQYIFLIHGEIVEYDKVWKLKIKLISHQISLKKRPLKDFLANAWGYHGNRYDGINIKKQFKEQF